MKRFAKSMLGVTLLEIMLVLAIAAMIIVMSVRYYQGAAQSQQVNSFLQQMQGLTATVESYAQGTSNYSNISSATLETLLPGGANAWNMPWGGAMKYTPTINGYTVDLSASAPAAALCGLITARLSADKHYTIAAGCTSITYKANV